MGDSLRRGLKDYEIVQQLDDSDLEIDLFGDDEGEDDELYVPDDKCVEHQSSDSSSDSSSSDQKEVPITVPGRGTGSRGIRRGRISGSTPSRQDISTLWQEREFLPTVIPFIEPSYLPVKSDNFGKHDYFAQYIDHDILELIVAKTNQMSIYKTGKNIKLTVTELNIFIGAMMVMSAINYPQIRMYWQTKYRVPIIADNISRNRFFHINNNLKMVFDPAVSPEERSRDKLWKVRPVLNRVVLGCNNQKKEKVLCIDEMIIPFSGKCGIRQYCPNKPNPTGLKAFILADPKGIVCDFHIYEGTTTYPEYEHSGLGLGEKVVLKLTKELSPGHIVYFDRYFMTEKLAKELLNRGIMCVGTIAKNRIPRTAKSLIKTEGQLKHTGRGTCQVLVYNNEMAITTWLDNKPVILLSTVYANATEDQCQRWAKKDKAYVTVNRPEVVKAYNTNMGGVDLADRLLSVCSYRYRTRKWTQRFFAHMIDLSVSNAWLLYRSDKVAQNVPLKKVQQLRGFKLELGELLIEAAADTDTGEKSSSSGSDPPINPIKRKGRKFKIPIPSDKKRKSGIAHLPAVSEYQNICRRQGCSKKTKMICSGCNIYLCVTQKRNCFKHFHISN